MVDCVGEQACRIVHDPRHIARGVDDRVPATALQRAKLAVTVAAQMLDVRKHIRSGLAAVKERQLVAVLERGAHSMRAEETRAAEEQDTQLAPGRCIGGECRPTRMRPGEQDRPEARADEAAAGNLQKFSCSLFNPRHGMAE